MKNASIIAEYNPFHLGHQWQVACTREKLVPGGGIVCVMSGHWVQGADCAITDKWTRARLALQGGVDLVLELPTPWALSSAESFARGAVEILSATGVVDLLSFGSEEGEVAPLQAAATCLDSEEYRQNLRQYLEEGISFPAARQRAVQTILGGEGDCLSNPNNNLGVEYLRAIARLNSPMQAMTVLRRGAGHGSGELVEGFASATEIRRRLRGNDWSGAESFMPQGTMDVLKEEDCASLNRCEVAILAKLRTMDEGDWSALPDSGAGEGLPLRLMDCARKATSVEEFLTLAKTKRYTHARLRRLLLWAFLGVRAEEKPAHPPYLRVLGMNERGRTMLKEMKGKATLPIITKPASVRSLGEDAQRLFEMESRYTDLYALTLKNPWPCGKEWTSNPVIL